MKVVRALTIALFSCLTFNSGLAQAGQVLPDSVLLDDLRPGSTVVFVKELKWEGGYKISDQLVCGRDPVEEIKKPNGRVIGTVPLVVPKGTRLQITSNDAIDTAIGI